MVVKPEQSTEEGSSVASCTLPEVATVDEVARFLRLNRKTVYDAVRANALPGARRVRNAIRVHRETLLAWLAAGGTISRPANGSVVRSRSHNR